LHEYGIEELGQEDLGDLVAYHLEGKLLFLRRLEKAWNKYDIWIDSQVAENGACLVSLSRLALHSLGKGAVIDRCELVAVCEGPQHLGNVNIVHHG
jgi:hypothetical protein